MAGPRIQKMLLEALKNMVLHMHMSLAPLLVLSEIPLLRMQTKGPYKEQFLAEFIFPLILPVLLHPRGKWHHS